MFLVPYLIKPYKNPLQLKKAYNRFEQFFVSQVEPRVLS